jgi:transposase-like protein
MPATPTDGHINLYCPRCRSDDAVLHSCGRSSTVYLCRDCEHQWERDPAGVLSSSTPEPGNQTARS